MELEFVDFDTPVGAITSTIRRGVRNVAHGDLVTLARVGGEEIGRGFVIHTWVGPLRMVPFDYLDAEHNPNARTLTGALDSLRAHYPDLTFDSLITAILFRRTA